jgi:hypothetical protein
VIVAPTTTTVSGTRVGTTEALFDRAAIVILRRAAFGRLFFWALDSRSLGQGPHFMRGQMKNCRQNQTTEKMLSCW